MRYGGGGREGGGSSLSLLLQHSDSEQWLSIDYLAGPESITVLF